MSSSFLICRLAQELDDPDSREDECLRIYLEEQKLRAKEIKKAKKELKNNKKVRYKSIM